MHVPERDGGELPNVRLQDIEAHNHAINILKAKKGVRHIGFTWIQKRCKGLWSMPMGILGTTANPYSRHVKPPVG